MCRCKCEISAVLTGRYGRTRDVPYRDHGCHGGHSGHGRHGAGRDTRWVTSLITELTTPITAVTAPVTAITAPITAITAPVKSITALITADTAPARRGDRTDVGTPVSMRLREPHRRSRASEALGHAAGLARGGGGGNRDGVSRRGCSFHHPI